MTTKQLPIYTNNLGLPPLGRMVGDLLGVSTDALNAHGPAVGVGLPFSPSFFFAFFGSPEAAHQIAKDNAQLFRVSPTARLFRRFLGDSIPSLDIDDPMHQLQRSHTSRKIGGINVYKYSQIMYNLAVEAFQQAAQKGGFVDVGEVTRTVTLAIVLESIAEGHNLTPSEQIGFADTFIRVFPYMAKKPIWKGATERLFPGPSAVYEEAIRLKEKLLGKIIAHRREMLRAEDKFDDLLQALLDAEGPVSDQSVIEGLYTSLLLAGHETTATVLAKAIVEIVKNQAIWSRMRAEVAELGGRIPTREDTLEYIRMVIDESLRTASAAYFLARTVGQQGVIIDGYELRPGMNVFFNLYWLHHREEYYPEPFTFKPERFDAAIAKGVFKPFGDGPRVCVGNAFTIEEMRQILFALVTRFDVELENAAQPFVLQSTVSLLHHIGDPRPRARFTRRIA